MFWEIGKYINSAVLGMERAKYGQRRGCLKSKTASFTFVIFAKNQYLSVAKKTIKAMAKIVFKSHNQGQISLFPASLDEKIPSESPVRLVNQIVDNLDISEIIDSYKGGGTSSYHPRMMLKVVLFAYLNNIYSCRKIENALHDRIIFMWLNDRKKQGKARSKNPEHT
jgi:hypothetical protein